MSVVVKNRFSLFKLIIDDLFKNHIVPLVLLCLIIVSAMAVLITTQQTRKQLFEKQQLLLERDVLENEWRNLILEENVLADPKRIEQKASSLGMQHVTPKTETIIVIKNK
ncbi:cell division protein FtsL [Orbaceae bacterium ac157xtp]